VEPDHTEIQRYDRHTQTGRLANILTMLTEPGKQNQRDASTS
jgi:hypothetical protein